LGRAFGEEYDEQPAPSRKSPVEVEV
jgi:hypothetical protein